MDINLPDVLAEVTAVFARYEAALVTNDVPVLDELFWPSPHTLRYGVGENLYGYDAICAFRASRPAQGLTRTLQHTVITTYGRDFATANTEFCRTGAAGPPQGDDSPLGGSDPRSGGAWGCLDTDKTGRQSQTWLRTPEGWRVVSAHVSLLAAPPPLA